MTRALLLLFVLFGMPLLVAYLYGHYNDQKRYKKELVYEWRAKLRQAEKKLGRRMSHEEIKKWLVYEWYKDRLQGADDFARKISLDLIARR